MISFTNTLNDLQGGSAGAYFEREDGSGGYVRVHDDYDAEYSGTDTWAKEDCSFMYGGDSSVRHTWRDNFILYDYGRLTIDYTYPDGETGQWSSDPFHVCGGSYMDFGEASYSNTDRSIVAHFPVWETLDPSQITLDSYFLRNSGTAESSVPELVSVTGWKDDDGNGWLRVIMRTAEELPVGSYWISIDTSIDTDSGNYWTDNTIADVEVTQGSVTHDAPAFTLVMPFNHTDGTPPQVRWTSQLNDLEGGTATASLVITGDTYTTVEIAEYSGEDSWDITRDVVNISALQHMWMGNSLLYGRCYIRIDYTYPDGTEDQWESRTFHLGYGSYSLPGTGTYLADSNLLTGEAPIWYGFDSYDSIEVSNLQLTELATGRALTGTLIYYDAWSEDTEEGWLEIEFRPQDALPAGVYRLSFDLSYDPDGNNVWTDESYIDFTVE